MFAIAGNRSGITVRISKRLDWTGRTNQSVENGFISSHRGKETNNFSSLITMHRVVSYSCFASFSAEHFILVFNFLLLFK